MSSQLIVHGYIEVLQGSEQANDPTLSALAGSRRDTPQSLVHILEPGRPGWRWSTYAFARSYKKTDRNEAERIQSEFEQLITSLTAVTAHLTIWDEDGIDSRNLDYAFGANSLREAPVWSRVSYRVHQNEPETLLPVSSSPSAKPALP